MTWAVIMKRGQFWCHLSVTAKKTSFPGSPFVSLRVHTNLDGNRRKEGRPWERGWAEQCPVKSRGYSFPVLGKRFCTQRKELILGFHVTSLRPYWCTEQQRKKSFGTLIISLCKTWATFCRCFVHQHGRLITWVKTKNTGRWPLFTYKLIFWRRFMKVFLHLVHFRLKLRKQITFRKMALLLL